MLKRTKFIAGISLLAQSVSFMVVFIILAVKKKSIWKAFLAVGLAGAAAGSLLTVSALKQNKKFKELLASMDDIYAPDQDDRQQNVPVDETASEAEFEA